MRSALVQALLVLTAVTLWPGGATRQVGQERPLPEIAPAPEFTLTSQDNAQVALADLRGKVVAVTFIYTFCVDTCPVLTPMMSFIQDQLGRTSVPRSHLFPLPSIPSGTRLKCSRSTRRRSVPILRAGLFSLGPRILFGT